MSSKPAPSLRRSPCKALQAQDVKSMFIEIACRECNWIDICQPQMSIPSHARTADTRKHGGMK